jgi:hypothetical protein
MKVIHYAVYPLLIFILVACGQPTSLSDTWLETQVVEQQKIFAGDGQAYDSLGTAVAVDGDLMVVGSPQVTGPTGNLWQGAAYVYQKDTVGTWQFLKKLFASDGTSSDNFGRSVAISGTTVVVGTDYYTNAAYIFERDQGGSNNWGQIKQLVTGANMFGYSVAISGNLVVVGAYADDVGPNFNQQNQGTAFLFSRNLGGTNNWGQVKRLIASDGTRSDAFGISVAISGTTVVVGAFRDRVGTTRSQGSAYVFQRDQGGINNWGQVKKLVAGDGTADDHFGASVAIRGNKVVIGAYRNDLGSGVPRGSAYVFNQNAGGINTWGQLRRLIASDRAPRDNLGSSVALSDDTIVVGASGDDIGTNTDQGSVYIY